MTTAKDIAVRLGLSVSTVGRALSDDPRISSATKARVAEIAADLGYTPSRAARMMRGASSGVVGLVVPDIRNGFYARTAHSLSAALGDTGMQLMLAETGDDPVREREQLRSLAGARIAGAVVVPSPTPLPETVRLLNAMLHVQLVRQLPVLQGPWMGIDDTEVLQRATAHLLALGHQRIAYIGGTTALPTAAARLRGFHAALAQAGLPEAAGPVYVGPPESPEHGADAVRRILADPRPPTAVVTASVQITQGVLDELPAQGVSIPADLSIVGFGDEAGWSWWGPGLTTTRLPTERLASACALWLRNRLAEAEASDDDRLARVLPTSLTVRGSTAPPTRAYRASLSRIAGGTDREPQAESS